MPGRRDPDVHDLGEVVGRHAGVGRHDDLEGSRSSPLAATPAVSPRSTDAKGSLARPLLVPRRQGLGDVVEGKEELELQHRFLRPERAVIVERGDALRRRQSKSGEPSRVTRATNRRIARLALPSFQDGSGSAADRYISARD